MVDQGKHPSAKSISSRSDIPFFNARTGCGPGVCVSGAAPRRQESDRHGMTVVAVRPGP